VNRTVSQPQTQNRVSSPAPVASRQTTVGGVRYGVSVNAGDKVFPPEHTFTSLFEAKQFLKDNKLSNFFIIRIGS
jgi:hypothetical protein